jgi:hypothetical protein
MYKVANGSSEHAQLCKHVTSGDHVLGKNGGTLGENLDVICKTFLQVSCRFRSTVEAVMDRRRK